VLLVLGYGAAIAFLKVNEDSMVFSGAALGEGWGPVPDDSVTIPWDSTRVTASDEVPVFLLESRLEDRPAAPWVIFFHGNGLLVGSPGCVSRYRFLREAGFQVLAVEFRGYGMSGAGAPSEEGVYADARAGWDYLTEDVGVDPERIVLYGWSLGSGIATQLASQVPAGGLITEGAFTALPAVGQAQYPWLPVSLIMKNRFDNLSRAETLSLPWLMFHSENDEVIPFSHAEALADVAEDARLITLHTGHGGGVGMAPDLARAAIRDFADQVLPEPSEDRDTPTGGPPER
jgi:pimeloyl-ACP methyl ester carboxylesterase